MHVSMHVGRFGEELQGETLPGRLELPNLRLTASRSNQLSYGSLVVNSACNHQGRTIARRGTQRLCQRSPGVEGRTPKCPTTKAILQNIACKCGHTSIGCEQGAICGAAAAQNKLLRRSPPDGEGALDFDAFSRSQVGARSPGDCRKKNTKMVSSLKIANLRENTYFRVLLIQIEIYYLVTGGFGGAEPPPIFFYAFFTKFADSIVRGRAFFIGWGAMSRFRRFCQRVARAF